MTRRFGRAVEVAGSSLQLSHLHTTYLSHIARPLHSSFLPFSTVTLPAFAPATSGGHCNPVVHHFSSIPAIGPWLNAGRAVHHGLWSRKEITLRHAPIQEVHSCRQPASKPLHQKVFGVRRVSTIYKTPQSVASHIYRANWEASQLSCKHSSPGLASPISPSTPATTTPSLRRVARAVSCKFCLPRGSCFYDATVRSWTFQVKPASRSRNADETGRLNPLQHPGRASTAGSTSLTPTWVHQCDVVTTTPFKESILPTRLHTTALKATST